MGRRDPDPGAGGRRGAGVGYAQDGQRRRLVEKKDLIILADVQRRTLQDTVTLNGTLARQELRKVTAIAQGRVSAVYAKDGSHATAGDRLFAHRRTRRDRGAGRRCGSSARSASATAATTCCSSSGSSRPPATTPAPMDTVFTEQTRFALAQWQAEHHYPGATPVDAADGHRLARRRAPATRSASRPSAGLDHRARRRRPHDRRDDRPRARGRAGGVPRRHLVTPFATPVLRIQSTNAVVSQGTPATFVITASEASATDLTVNLELERNGDAAATS